MDSPAAVQSVIHRNLLFVSGKGGVGKTVVSQAIALAQSRKGRRVLWISIEDPLRPPGELRQINPHLWYLNCDPTLSFEEYVQMKIGFGTLARLFIHNKLMKYLAQAAPGIHELVLLGKIWHERTRYDHVVVDMPSTGYGLAMFQSTSNFSHLFKGGPIQKDADAMLDTFKNPEKTGLLIVALPEEMPLVESIELDQLLKGIFPENHSAFFVNRRFPKITQKPEKPISTNPDQWPSPLADSLQDYALKRAILEDFNLKLWTDQRISFGELPYVRPSINHSNEPVVEALSQKLAEIL